MARFAHPLIGLGLAIALGSAALAAQPVSLKSETVAQGRITLGDLFDGAGRAAGVVVAPAPNPGGTMVLDASLVHYHDVLKAVPDEWRPAADTRNLAECYRQYVADRWTAFDAPLRRYLAAKAFASWTAYQGRGFLTIVRGLEAALALVRVEAARQCRDTNGPLDANLLRDAFRHADFALNHLAAGDELAEGWSKVEA